jgi:hypothetical protein
MGHHGGRGTAAAAVIVAYLSHFSSFFLIFPYICVSPPIIETVSIFAAGSLLGKNEKNEKVHRK